MKIGIIVIISVLGGALLLVLSICLTTFFSPIIGEILDELEEKGKCVADKIHNKLHPEPQAVSLSQGLKNVNVALRKFASALGETTLSNNTCTGNCLECNKVNECEEYAELKRRKRSEAQRID